LPKEFDIEHTLPDDAPLVDTKALLANAIYKKLADPIVLKNVVEAMFKAATGEDANAAALRNLLPYIAGKPEDFAKELKPQILVKQKIYRITGPLLCPHCHKCTIDKPDTPDAVPEEKQDGAVH
jgi:hypothetical protein